MGIKKGYKQTDIGVIPEDWDVKPLGKIAIVVGGGTPSTVNLDYWNGNINWFTPTEIGKSKYSFQSNRKITKQGLENSSAKLLPIGTILLTTRATIGDISILKQEGCTNQGFQSLVAKDNVDSEYLYYFVSTLRYELLKNATGSTFLEITPKKIKQILVSLPTDKSEQTAIATALSDIDALITALDKKITKKKLIKQGAMQQLLTGKKRLPGFSEEWVEKSVKDLGVVGRGRVISQIEIFYSLKSEYPVYSSQTTNAGIMGYIDTFDFDGEYITWTTDGVNAGTVFYRNGKFNCTNVCGTIKIIDINKNNSLFVALRLGIEAYKYVSTNLANPKLMNGVMKSIQITLPPTLKEQTAIAQILSDMDNEIAALEAKRDKYKQVKSGMMQELLTGKIRLVNEKVVSIVKQEEKTIQVDFRQAKKPAHNDQINEAVVVSFLVNKFGTVQYPLSRFRYTKYAYLLHRQHEHEASGYNKHAAGPYKPDNRYKGAEGIAIRNKYISKVKNSKSDKDAFVANENIGKALNYFNDWYGAGIQQWMEQFRYYKNDYLEVLTTVDKSIVDLTRINKPINVETIKEYIASIPQWKDKLDKPYFTDFNIQKAINESYKLFGDN
jgi:type I restriction enzyme S subunit